MLRIADQWYASDLGRQRQGNEDNFFVRAPVFVVADGMGGANAGEVASEMAVRSFDPELPDGNPAEALVDVIEGANRRIHERSRSDERSAGMGTTVTAAYVSDEEVIVAHVGDSRAYLLRDGELRQITTDHSRVQELVEDGRLTADEAAVHPMRNIVTRAVGVEASVDVDVYPVELQPDDRVLFCSDGLTDMLHDDFLGTELRREDDPARAATRLIDAANSAGGVDNITVVVISVTDEEPLRGNLAAPAVLVAEAAEEAPPESEPKTRRQRRIRTGKRRVGRVLLWVIPVLVIIGIAIGAVGWYARNNYYVTANQGRVTVYKGVPGGLLWWNPTIDRRTNVRVADLVAADAAAVRDEHTFSSVGDANAYVRRIGARAESATTTTSTTSTSTTTTTTTSTTTTTTAPGP